VNIIWKQRWEGGEEGVEKGERGAGEQEQGGAFFVGTFPETADAVNAHWTSWGRARQETGCGQPVECHVLIREIERVFSFYYTTVLGQTCKIMLSWGKLGKFNYWGRLNH